jgi:hypothetical protein
MMARVIVLRSRLSPSDAEQRLRLIIRPKRTLAQVVTRKAAYRPAGTAFVGTIGAGRFEVRRLRDEVWNEQRSDGSFAAVRGRIEPAPDGSEIRVAFTPPWGLALTLAVFFLAVSSIMLANADRFPLFGGAHAIVLAALAVVCGGGYLAFRMDAAKCETHLRAALAAEPRMSALDPEPPAPAKLTWGGLLGRLFLVSILVPSGGGLVYLGVHMMRTSSSPLAGALIGVPMILFGLIFLLPLPGIVSYKTRIWMLVGRVGSLSPSDDPRRKRLD